MIHLGIVEDEPSVLDSLTRFFAGQPDFVVVLTANTVESFLERLSGVKQIDVLLLDIHLPGGMSGLEGIRHIKINRPNINIIMLTAADDADSIFKALCAGAGSYVSKRSALTTIKEAITIVYKGGAYMSPAIARKVIDYFAPKKQDPDLLLTPRQEQIVQGLVDGLSYKMIADKYMITIETVRDHIKKIYKKLEVNSKAELIKKRIDGEI